MGDTVVLVATNREGSVNGKTFVVGGILESAPRPGTVVTVVHPGAEPGDLGRLPAAVQGMLATATGPTALVCAGTRCAAPVTDPHALPGVVETFAAGDAERSPGGEHR